MLGPLLELNFMPSAPSPVVCSTSAQLIKAISEQDAWALDQHFLGTGMATPTHCWRPSEEAAPTQELRALLRYWGGLRKGDGLPHYAGFDVLDIPSAVGFLMLLDVIDGGEDFHYRVYGTGIAQDTGFDMTGKRLSSVPTMAPLAAYFMASYRAVIARRAALLAYHQPPPGQPIRLWVRLILPLINDRKEISRLLVGNMPRAAV